MEAIRGGKLNQFEYRLEMDESLKKAIFEKLRIQLSECECSTIID